MNEKIINCKLIAKELNDFNKNLIKEKNLSLNLTVIQIGDNNSSNIYIKMKKKACNYVGINFNHLKFDENISQSQIENEINKLNENKNVTGIIIQLPLPKHLDNKKIINLIDINKDADGFSSNTLGNVMLNEQEISPATPKGIVKIIKYLNIDLPGKNIVIIGRSNIVGKPLANMLINEQATTIVCNSKTKNLHKITKLADILIVAIGSPKFITKKFVNKKMIIIDVGTNFIDNVYCGDVDFNSVVKIIKNITPVPGGVGPMTVACLIDNVVKLYLKNQSFN